MSRSPGQHQGPGLALARGRRERMPGKGSGRDLAPSWGGGGGGGMRDGSASARGGGGRGGGAGGCFPPSAARAPVPTAQVAETVACSQALPWEEKLGQALWKAVWQDPVGLAVCTCPTRHVPVRNGCTRPPGSQGCPQPPILCEDPQTSPTSISKRLTR